LRAAPTISIDCFNTELQGGADLSTTLSYERDCLGCLERVIFNIIIFNIIAILRKTLERVSLPTTVRAATPKDKATKAFHPDLPEEDAGKNRQIESWHSFETF
jgi:hypothetical protein